MKPVRATIDELLADITGDPEVAVPREATTDDDEVVNARRLDVEFADALAEALMAVVRTIGAELIPELVALRTGTVAFTVVLVCSGAPPAQ